MKTTFNYTNLPSGRTAININGENAYGNYRNKFKAKCFRMYKGLITDAERANNFAVDNAIFGTIV